MNKYVALPLIAILLLVAVVTETSAKGGPSPVDWVGSLQLIKSPLDTPEPPDGQSHGVNNTHGGTQNIQCAWNDEDETGMEGTGNLGSGVSTQSSLCMVADLDCCNSAAYPKFIYARVYVKPTANLHVWATLDGPVMLPDGRVVTSTIEAQTPFVVNWGNNSVKQEYQLCGPDAVARTANRVGWPALTYWPLMPSNSAYGMQISYTLHIQNMGSQPARGIQAFWEIAFNDWNKGDSYFPYYQHYAPPDTLIPCENIP